MPSLRIIEHGIKYSLDIILSLRSMYGRIVIRMADNFCTDRAGNRFAQTNGSTIIIHFGETEVTLVLQQVTLSSFILTPSLFKSNDCFR